MFLKDQYVFLHVALLEAISCGDTEISTDQYRSILDKLKSLDMKTDTTGIESQFVLLSQVTADPDSILCPTAKSHPDKNRSNKYLPCKCDFLLFIYLFILFIYFCIFCS